jgi:tripeptide aminopeptidase
MRDQLLDLFLQLVRIPSPTGSERAVADFVAAYLRDLGLEPRFDIAGAGGHGPAECGNVLAYLPPTDGRDARPTGGTGETPILLNAHLDTVTLDHPVVPVVEGDVVRSDGTTILGADDKAGVALILLTMRRLIEQELPHPGVWVVFTVAEETGLWGAQGLDLQRLAPRPELGFVLDGHTQPGEMVTGAPSAVSLDVTITGCAAHAGVCPEQGISALQTAARALADMRLGRIDEGTTANVGTCRSGSARNIVPEVCTLQAEARGYDEAKLSAQVAHMQERFETTAREAGAQVHTELSRSFTTFALDADSTPVRRATAAAERAGLSPTTARGGGGSDANVFNERGLPSVMLAIGGANVHTPAEELRLPEALACLEWLGEIVGGS